MKILIYEVLGLFVEAKSKQNVVLFKWFYTEGRIKACVGIFVGLFWKT